MRKLLLTNLIIIGFFAQMFAQEKQSYYNLESFSQYDISDKTYRYAKYTWDDKTLKIKTYSDTKDTIVVSNFEIISQKKHEDNKMLLSAKRVEKEALDAEVMGSLYFALLYEPSIYHENFLEVTTLYEGFENVFEEKTETIGILKEKGESFTLVKVSFFEKAKTLPKLTEKTSKEDFIKVLKQIKSKFSRVEKHSGRASIEDNAFMVSALLEASFNGFASKGGFKDLLSKYKTDEEVKLLFDEIMAMAGKK